MSEAELRALAGFTSAGLWILLMMKTRYRDVSVSSSGAKIIETYAIVAGGGLAVLFGWILL